MTSKANRSPQLLLPKRVFRTARWARSTLGVLLALSLAQPADAQEKAIPVKTGKAGTLNKSGNKKVSTGIGVFKRGGSRSKLDPDYDPAKASEKIGKAPIVPAPSAPTGGPATSEAEAAKRVEDSLEFKTNFDKLIKCRKLPLNAKVSLDFEQAPLESITKLISCWTDTNFFIASNRRGAKVTILSPQPVSVYEAYRAFLSALNVNGMTLTKQGAFYHIVDSAAARSSGAGVYGVGQKVPNEEVIVTQLVRLKHIEAKELEGLLNKFKSKTGDIFTYEPNNTLIITDTASNIRRMTKLLDDVDVPLGKDKIFIRPVQHMQATELVEKINAVFEGGSGGSGRATTRRRGRAPPPAAAGAKGVTSVQLSKIIADERTNQLILITTRSSYMKIDALIRKLDVPIPGEGQIHIHHLENADAEELASTLSSLAGGAASRSTSRGKPARGAAPKGGGGSAALFEGEVKITAHKATNALVIEASLKDYLSLTKVIAQLDRRRKQVYVEAVIMEISTTKNRNMQIAGSAGKVFDIGGEEVPFVLGLGGLGMGGADLSQLNSGGLAAGLQGPLLQVNTGNTGGTNSAVPGGVTLSIPAFGFLVQAIQENSDVNVLSTPHILTLNNEDAEIQVGRKVPYRSASLGGGLGGLGGLASGLTSQLSGLAGGALGALGGLAGAGSMVQHVDVDLTLKITPQINESDFIKLKIEEQLDEIEAMDPNLGPTTSKRKVSNTVVVRDQQPVVIGGLITDRESTGVAKIPLLGDLPLIGVLFRKSAKRVEKKNLMLIIVPHIIKDPSDLRRLHDEKMNQIRKFADELATRRKEHAGKVDYRKKQGVMQRIFHSVEEAATERKLMEKAYYDNAEVDLVGPPEHHDLDYDPFSPEYEEDGSRKQAPPGGGAEVEVIDLPDARSGRSAAPATKAAPKAEPKAAPKPEAEPVDEDTP